MTQNAAPDTQRDDCTLIDWSVLERRTRTEQYELFRTALEQIDNVLATSSIKIARIEEILMELGMPDESADAEREQARAEHLGELVAEREMVQAQTPVVNVEEESG